MAHAMSDNSGVVQQAELRAAFRNKHGGIQHLGPAPRRRHRFDYYMPADVYEAFVGTLVHDGCRWLDVGGGSSLFPDNPRLARTLAARASKVVAVDPSDNVHENPFVHERVQATIENYGTSQRFDLATLRMVAEHVSDPDAVVGALGRLLRPGGLAVIFTVNRWSPTTIVSSMTPFAFHHAVKRVLWRTEEHDTFPVEYRMNSRRALREIFERHGFREAAFSYLDDLSVGSRFAASNYAELCLWRVLQGLRLRYPENCLLGAYQRR
jgi:2-polyprenyl-3-methyl-5-hydroxy-6-metoxy-1,4-benzoquinol methylase